MATHDLLRAWRQQHSLTQLAVAEHLGITLRTVARWEVGQGRPDVAQAAELDSRWPGLLDAIRSSVDEAEAAASRQNGGA